MAKRPIFVPINGYPFIQKRDVEFEWYPGFSKTQAQKSITSLHQAAKGQNNITRILEISSKSPDPMGVALSAFNLVLQVDETHSMSVECAFQGSKVFESGGPFHDLYDGSSLQAKRDERLRNSGELISFNFLGEVFPNKPETAFYDWLYLRALMQHDDLVQYVIQFEGFSDIAFNPKRSLNCQARSVALFVSLHNLGLLDQVEDKESYLKLVSPTRDKQHRSDTDLSELQQMFLFDSEKN
jgi:hypothetical protein